MQTASAGELSSPRVVLLPTAEVTRKVLEFGQTVFHRHDRTFVVEIKRRVVEAITDYETKTAVVIYDDEIADVELFTEATTDADYPSTALTPDV